MHVGRMDTQDSWVVFPPLPPPLLSDRACGFVLGANRGDGVLAQTLYDAGLDVSNPTHDILTVHVHQRYVKLSKDSRGEGNEDEQPEGRAEPKEPTAALQTGAQPAAHGANGAANGELYWNPRSKVRWTARSRHLRRLLHSYCRRPRWPLRSLPVHAARILGCGCGCRLHVVRLAFPSPAPHPARARAFGLTHHRCALSQARAAFYANYSDAVRDAKYTGLRVAQGRTRALRFSFL